MPARLLGLPPEGGHRGRASPAPNRDARKPPPMADRHPGALVAGVALFPRVNLHAPREGVRVEPSPGLYFHQSAASRGRHLRSSGNDSDVGVISALKKNTMSRITGISG